MANARDELEAVAMHRDDVWFWLYSSGSTGKPGRDVLHDESRAPRSGAQRRHPVTESR
ncbi:MAG: hypothetical protein JO181_11435 [Solirubrobacterales bacterium]|nr:hypothetical protein [Solirubrobacterales bacterium]